MPSIEELLDQAENETSAIEPVNDILEIDPETRTVLIPDSEIIFGVEADQRAERKYFRCPKIVGNNIDLSELEIYVIFQNAGGSDEENRDAYHVQDLEDTGDGYVTFSWELTEKVTRYVGQVSFVVAATRTLSDGTLQNRWSTTIATGKSLIGLQTGMSENEQQQASDLYTQLITELNAKAEIKKSEITTLTNEKKSLLENTGTNQKNLIESEGTKQIQAVENKGTATLATIPEDYTALNTSVNDLNDLMHMKAPAIVEEATSGKEITVNDSADGMRLQGMNVYGKSWQKTTTGANLFNLTKKSETVKGITFDVRNNGTIHVSGTNNESSALYVILGNFNVTEGQKVIFSGFFSFENSDIETYIEVGGVVVLGKINANKSNTYVWKSTLTGVVDVKFKIRANVTVDIELDKMMINIGDTVLPYEPYTGGKPSTSPDYPQEIQSVGYVLSTGKNLFDFSKLNVNYGLNTKGKTITIPAKTNNVGYYNSLKELCPGIKAGDTYVLSAKTSNPEALRTIHLVNTNADFNFGKAFVPTEEQVNDKIAFYNNEATEKENVVSEIQLEEGSEATSYEPYTGGVPALYQKNIEVGVTGKNLINVPTFTLVAPNSGADTDNYKYRVVYDGAELEGGYCFSSNINVLVGNVSKISVIFIFENSNIKSNIKYDANIVDGKISVATNEKFNAIYVYAGIAGGTRGNSVEFSEIQLEKSTEATVYEPYKQSQSLPITTPTGLPAIPVPLGTSGITYTDANGQAWIADEIDFARGKYIQRVWQAEFDGSEDEKWYKDSEYVYCDCLPITTFNRSGFCNQYITSNVSAKSGLRIGNNNSMLIIFGDFLDENALSNWKAHLAEHPLKVMTYLDTPIETDLSEEQIQAYKAIHTNKPTTIISNDADAWMGASYAADTKIWIENKIKEIVTS